MKGTGEGSFPLLRVENLKVWFPVGRSGLLSMFRKEKKYVRAVDGVSFDMEKGEIFSLVGESGAGKTTTGLAIVDVYKPTEGRILFNGLNVHNASKKTAKELRRKIQMIFQDPFEALPPHMTVFDILGEGIDLYKLAGSAGEKFEIVAKALEQVGIVPPEQYIAKYPHQLSGGQKQRIAIASVLILHPELVVADEPVSMIDVSLRWDIIKLFMDLRARFGLTYIFVLHDLALAKCISTRIAILYLGQIVELGETEDVIRRPIHPYAHALVSVAPSQRKREKILLQGEIPNPIDMPSGCRFHPRCPRASNGCSRSEPQLVEIESNHFVRCLQCT